MKNAILISWVFSLMSVASVPATIINVPDDYSTSPRIHFNCFLENVFVV